MSFCLQFCYYLHVVRFLFVNRLVQNHYVTQGYQGYANVTIYGNVGVRAPLIEQDWDSRKHY